MNGFGKKLNESFNTYFKKLNESNFEEFDNMTKEPIFEFPNGEYFYVDVDKENNLIFAGSATNNGIIREFEIEYDFDDSLDGNLSRLYDTIIEERPELLDEEPMDESLEDLKDYPGAKKIDTIKGIAIDTDRVQSEEAEDKYGFYQGDIIFGDEHLEVGKEYTIDVYEIPEENWDEEGTGFGIGKDNPYFMVLKNKSGSKINEGHFEDFIKKKVVKLFNQEINDSDIEHKIDDDGYGFTIVRSNGKTLTYDATTGKFNYNKNKIKEPIDESLSFNPREIQKVIKELEHNFNAEFMFEHDRGEGYSGLVFNISNVKDKQGFKNFIKDYYKIIKTKRPNVIMLVDKQPLPWEKNESLNNSIIINTEYGNYEFLGKVNIDGETLFKFKPLDEKAIETSKGIAEDNGEEFDGYAYMTNEEVYWTLSDSDYDDDFIDSILEESFHKKRRRKGVKEDLDKYQKYPDRYNIKLSKLKDIVEDYFKTTNGDATIILNGEYYNIIND